MKKTFTYQDLHPQFKINPITKDFQINTDERAIRFSIRQIILTNHYERPFNPDFGGNINEYLFELATENTAAILTFNIKNLIEQYEPRVLIEDVRVLLLHDNNSMRIDIDYMIRNTNRLDSVNLTLKRTR